MIAISGQNILSICYALSLFLAYAIGVALIVTACCMYQEPEIVIVLSRSTTSSQTPDGRIRIVYEE